MSRLRVHSFGISLDGYGAQDLDNPLGMHVAISPVILGKGEHLFGGIDTLALGYVCTRHVASPNATHFVLTRQ